VEINWLDAVRHQTAGRDEVAVGVDRRPVIPGGEFNIIAVEFGLADEASDLRSDDEKGNVVK
jgi:hypothetical protein